MGEFVNIASNRKKTSVTTPFIKNIDLFSDVIVKQSIFFYYYFFFILAYRQVDHIKT